MSDRPPASSRPRGAPPPRRIAACWITWPAPPTWSAARRFREAEVEVLRALSIVPVGSARPEAAGLGAFQAGPAGRGARGLSRDRRDAAARCGHSPETGADRPEAGARRTSRCTSWSCRRGWHPTMCGSGAIWASRTPGAASGLVRRPRFGGPGRRRKRRRWSVGRVPAVAGRPLRRRGDPAEGRGRPRSTRPSPSSGEGRTDPDRFLAPAAAGTVSVPVTSLVGYAVSRLAPPAAHASSVGATARLPIGEGDLRAQ